QAGLIAVCHWFSDLLKAYKQAWRSDIELGQVALFFDPGAPLRRLSLAHQHVEHAGGVLRSKAAVPYRQQPARVRVHGGFPQLLGIHLTEPLEAADAPGTFAHAFFAQLVLRGLELAAIQTIYLARGPLALG